MLFVVKHVRNINKLHSNFLCDLLFAIEYFVVKHAVFDEISTCTLVGLSLESRTSYLFRVLSLDQSALQVGQHAGQSEALGNHIVDRARVVIGSVTLKELQAIIDSLKVFLIVAEVEE